MRVAVFGMGHVGLVTAALLAEVGHYVTGVDVDRQRIKALCHGQMPFHEPGLEDMVRTQFSAERLCFMTNGALVAGLSDVVLICVGTPSDTLGQVDLGAVYDALRVIAEESVRSDFAPVVVLRSTVPPTAIDDLALYLHQASGGRIDNLCVNPEFLREGSALVDFRNPPLVVIGADDERAGDRLIELYQPFFWWENDLIARTDCKTAMLVKYVSNAWHALKVTFANEMGDVARAVGVDGQELMRIFAQDTALNISPAYLKPGAPFGGSCLPKDLRALLAMAGRDAPAVLQAVRDSNYERMWRIVNQAIATGARKFGIIGVSFKAGTDDVRESPWMLIAEHLTVKGGEVRMYDPDVRVDAYEVLTDDLDALLQWAECVIVGKSELLTPGALSPPHVIYGDGRCS